MKFQKIKVNKYIIICGLRDWKILKKEKEKKTSVHKRKVVFFLKGGRICGCGRWRMVKIIILIIIKMHAL